MNARYVGLTPYADWYSFFSFSRICTTFDMSTSIADVTCAEVSSERRMWSAIPRRIADMGSIVSPACAAAGAAAGGGGGGGGAAGGGGGARGALAAGAGGAVGAGSAAGAGAGGGGACAAAVEPPPSMKAWMSLFVTRP